METKGIEQSRLTPSKTPISEKPGAESGAGEDKIDPDLAISEWFSEVYMGNPGYKNLRARSTACARFLSCFTSHQEV
jgi:hypothetical protein